MGTAEVFCDDCDKWYTIEYEFVSDLFGIKCPECKSDSVWFGDIDDGEDPCDVQLGRGGCRQK